MLPNVVVVVVFPTLFVKCVKKPHYFEGNKRRGCCFWNAVSIGVCLVYPLSFSERTPSLITLCEMTTCSLAHTSFLTPLHLLKV